MASLRRNKNFNPDPQTKFLYVIIKQLDLRSIDWQDVANEIGINNGHAARMRYSRLRAQFEGPAFKIRDQKTKDERKPAKSKIKPGLELSVKDLHDDSDGSTRTKKEIMGYDNSMMADQGIIKSEHPEGFTMAPFIKQEPLRHGMGYHLPPPPHFMHMGPAYTTVSGSMTPIDMHQGVYPSHDQQNQQHIPAPNFQLQDLTIKPEPGTETMLLDGE